MLAEVGLPAGVLNVITTSRTGDGDGAADPRPAAAQADLHRVHAGRARRWSSSPPSSCCGSRWSSAATRPFLVFADADLDKAVDGAMLAKMRNMGEACTAANRFLVHESVADEFAARFAERMAALTRRARHRGRRPRSAR